MKDLSRNDWLSLAMFNMRSFVTLSICLTSLLVVRAKETSKVVFFKKFGRYLEGEPVRIISNGSEGQCLGHCMQKENCKAFNFRQRSTNESPICALFDTNRCRLGKRLLDEAGVDYFDAVPDGKCQSKW